MVSHRLPAGVLPSASSAILIGSPAIHVVSPSLWTGPWTAVPPCPPPCPQVPDDGILIVYARRRRRRSPHPPAPRPIVGGGRVETRHRFLPPASASVASFFSCFPPAACALSLHPGAAYILFFSIKKMDCPLSCSVRFLCAVSAFPSCPPSGNERKLGCPAVGGGQGFLSPRARRRPPFSLFVRLALAVLCPGCPLRCLRSGCPPPWLSAPRLSVRADLLPPPPAAPAPPPARKKAASPGAAPLSGSYVLLRIR